MNKKSQPAPLHEQLIDKVQKEGLLQTSFSSDEVRAIFTQQAQTDESGDLPVLLPGFSVTIRQGELHLHAPYTIDKDKKHLIFDGIAENNEEGILAETTPMKVLPEFLKDRVVGAFGEKLDLPHFIKLITEDALGGKVIVEKLFVDGEKLGMILERGAKPKS